MLSMTFQPLVRLTPSDLLAFGQLNRELVCELNANGSITLRFPPKLRYFTAINVILKALTAWNERTGEPEGTVISTTIGFVLRNGAVRHPAVAWVKSYKMAAQTGYLIEQIPDFFIEFLTPTDSLALAQGRMMEYISNGAALGWLIDLDTEMVYIFRQNFENSVENFHNKLSGGDILRGFEFMMNVLI